MKYFVLMYKNINHCIQHYNTPRMTFKFLQWTRGSNWLM